MDIEALHPPIPEPASFHRRADTTPLSVSGIGEQRTPSPFEQEPVAEHEDINLGSEWNYGKPPSLHASLVSQSSERSPLNALDYLPFVDEPAEPALKAPSLPGPPVIDLTRDTPEPSDPHGPQGRPRAGTVTAAYEPSVFDILSELPSVDFIILGRQEEIYARRELPVEDRAIAALWARWIAVNR